MRRVAIVAPEADLRAALVLVADAGTVQLDELMAADAAAPAPVQPRLLAAPPDPDVLRAQGRVDLLAGEAQLQERMADAAARGHVRAVTGWMPESGLAGLSSRLGTVGSAVVPLPRPRWGDPPTLLPPARTRGAARLVSTYATVPYEDVDPTLFAVLAYVVMFGVMFADAGHGLLLVAAGVVLRLRRPRPGRPDRLAKVRPAWPFVIAAGAVATAAGVAYGEFFGPTGVLPFAAVDPLGEPLLLLGLAVGLGAVLLAIAYGIGTVNRVREGGWGYALYEPAGPAGLALFLGLAAVALGVATRTGWPIAAGAVVACLALFLCFAGLWSRAGRGAAAVLQAVVELFDVVIRLGSNVVSFARLAAFGMTHAALAAVVWLAASALWSGGTAVRIVAVAVFVAGNALTFGLEALVAGVQALRLEYYELFSRVFQGEGRPFRPWHIPLDGGHEEVVP
jgi:V/A-type H+-transporting ATPase subunit I